MKTIKEIETRIAAIRKDIEDRGDMVTSEELDAYESELKELKEERAAIQQVAEKRSNLLRDIASGKDAGKQIRTFESPGDPKQTEERSSADPYGTIEYRNAFKTFIQTGVRLPELRANEVTISSEIVAVVPTTILQEVIRKMGQYGQLFSRVRKTNVAGGEDVPIMDLVPVANWVDEVTASEDQQVKADTKVSFKYHGLECKVAQSLVSSIVALPFFESVLVDAIYEAMIKKLEQGIVKGTGTGQVTGISVDARVPAGNKVTLTAAEFAKWDAWKKKVFAKLPLRYKAGATWLMAGGTFDGYIDGMVDTAGQPIGRVNYNITDELQNRFGGKEVILVEDDVLASYDSASTGDPVAILMNLHNYAINSNMSLSMFKWTNHETNKVYNKAMMIADGRLLDPNGVIIVLKGA